MSLDYALEKWKEVREGKRVIFSDESLDALIAEFNPRPDGDEDADIFFHDFVTTANPRRVGIRDAYIGYSTKDVTR